MRTGDAAPSVAALDELKAYLRIETAEEDALLAGLLRAATAAAEAVLGEMLLVRDVREEGEPVDGWLSLSARPVRGVELVERLDGEAPAPLGPEAWRLATDRSGRSGLCLAEPVQRIGVRYRAGRADDWNGVAEPVRLAVLRGAAHAFASRDSGGGEGLPAMFHELLAPFRQVRI